MYISSIMYGSPAIDNLRPIQWILEVDGQKVRTLDDMINVISNLKERDEEEEYTRVRMMGKERYHLCCEREIGFQVLASMDA